MESGSQDDRAPAWRPLSFPGDVARYDLGDLGVHVVPKDPISNLDYRRRLIEDADQDNDKQAVLRAMSARSCLWWINTFGWTYKQLKVRIGGKVEPVVGKGANVPFITWPVQDESVKLLLRCIRQGTDAAFDKSRDMGASWMILTVFHWYWQFQRDVNFLEVSRKLDLVDNRDDPDSLFWKHDYLLRMQPGWLIPRFRRNTSPSPKIVNLDMRSTIIGQATTGDVGHGGRKTAALFDEMARMREARTVWEGAASMTACRVANSTPRGPVFFSKLVRSAKVLTVRLPWWDNPEKGRDRRTVSDPDTHRIKVTSPWYEGQVKRAVTKREIAENLDMDHAGAGMVFFDSDVLSRQLSMYADRNPATYIGELAFSRSGGIYDDIDVALVKAEPRAFKFRSLVTQGHWRLWCDLAKSNGRWRPAQDRSYVFGIDVAHGIGASNSVISVLDVDARWKVAEFASPSISPSDLAREVRMASIWFGGVRGVAFVAWEANGVGSSMGKRLLRLGCSWYYRTTKFKEQGEPKTRWPGWWSNRDSKIEVLGDYRAALAQDQFRNPSQPALEEAAEYVWYENGGVGPGELQEEKGDARSTHGDRVIADALAWHASLWAPRMSPPRRAPVVGSVGERRARAAEAARKQRRERSVMR